MGLMQLLLAMVVAADQWFLVMLQLKDIVVHEPLALSAPPTAING